MAELKKGWYVIHTHAGYENKVKDNLEKRIRSMEMQDKIFRVLVPMEQGVEHKDGKKKTVMRKVFPGYVLVEMIMTDDSWYVVRNTPGVAGFVGVHGAGTRPVPLESEEVEAILQQMAEEKPKPVIRYQVGEKVRVLSGPFADFVGPVEEVDAQRAKLKVLVDMFGRLTPIELDFHQVEKE